MRRRTLAIGTTMGLGIWSSLWHHGLMKLARWWFNMFFLMFIPIPGEMIPFWKTNFWHVFRLWVGSTTNQLGMNRGESWSQTLFEKRLAPKYSKIGLELTCTAKLDLFGHRRCRLRSALKSGTLASNRTKKYIHATRTSAKIVPCGNESRWR